jgi:hypothetical protein
MSSLAERLPYMTYNELLRLQVRSFTPPTLVAPESRFSEAKQGFYHRLITKQARGTATASELDELEFLRTGLLGQSEIASRYQQDLLEYKEIMDCMSKILYFMEREKEVGEFFDEHIVPTDTLDMPVIDSSKKKAARKADGRTYGKKRWSRTTFRPGEMDTPGDKIHSRVPGPKGWMSAAPL